MKKVSENVRYLLENHPELRGDDSKLIAKYYELYCGITSDTPFMDVMYYHEDYGVPSFETIRRSRQKLQEHVPYLKATDDIIATRKEQEYKVYEYAKSMEV